MGGRRIHLRTAQLLLCVVVLIAGVLLTGNALRQRGDPVIRLAGDDRIGTAAAVSRAHWEQTETVVLASAAGFADALAGGALAAELDAPLLLTTPAGLSEETRGEIQRLGARHVSVLGGPQAVSDAVVDTLRAAGLTVHRLGGGDRYETAAHITRRLGPAPEVALASGETFADALAAGALAASPDRVPTLLTMRDGLPIVTEQALTQVGAQKVTIVGDKTAVSKHVEDRLTTLGYDIERLAGPTRYETAALVGGEALRRITAPTLPVVIATGDDFSDTLAAAALAARLDGLLVTLPRQGPARAPKVERLLTLAGPRLDSGWIVGSQTAVTDTAPIVRAISTGPLRFTPVAQGRPGDGAAATVEPLATQAALDVLASGGNAVDAAIAAAGMIGVAEPFSAGIGGGGFMVVYSAAEDRVTTFDARETAPAAFFSEVFLDPETREPISFDERATSGLGVGVPGTVAGWALALERFGTRSLAELLEPAIEAADYGFPLDRVFVSEVKENAERFAAFTSTAALYLPLDGQPQPEGAWFRNPDLAETMEQVAEAGPRALYTGPVAEAIVGAVREPPIVPGTDLEIRPGLMTTADLASYKALVREPVTSEYREYTLYGMGLPSSGGLTIALALNQLERFDLGAMSREEALHNELESIRLAWADRNAYMGDPAYVDAPVSGLLAQKYADNRSALITETPSTTLREAGDPFAYQDVPGASGPQATPAESSRTGATTHLTVADAEGTIVSYTFTIEQIGGSGIVVPGYGILLNNELTDFDPVPPHPNAPAAGKRPRSSMSPTIVFRDGKPVFALGTPGGTTIIPTVFHTLIGALDLGDDLPTAITAPRVMNFNDPSSVAETHFLTTPQAKALRANGHTFEDVDEIGAVTGIAFGRDGAPTAVVEPVRRGSGAAGVTSNR